jgi:hypothetical protein
VPSKRLAAVAGALIAAALGLLYVGPCSYPEPDFATAAKPAPPGARDRLPVFVTPESDRENAIVAVFVGPGGEVNVVWRDEDHPWRIIDHAYDLVRWFKFGRVMDVERFRMDGDAIEFGSTYAREQPWDVFIARHYAERVPIAKLEKRGDRPVLHVTTWNHMLREIDSNPSLPKAEDGAYQVYEGTREDVEAIFRRVKNK